MDAITMAHRAELIYKAAPKDKHRIASCTFKRRYRSLDEATSESYYNEHMYGTIAEPYQCRYCGGWHLTTKGK